MIFQTGKSSESCIRMMHEEEVQTPQDSRKNLSEQTLAHLFIRISPYSMLPHNNPLQTATSFQAEECQSLLLSKLLHSVLSTGREDSLAFTA